MGNKRDPEVGGLDDGHAEANERRLIQSTVSGARMPFRMVHVLSGVRSANQMLVFKYALLIRRNIREGPSRDLDSAMRCPDNLALGSRAAQPRTATPRSDHVGPTIVRLLLSTSRSKHRSCDVRVVTDRRLPVLFETCNALISLCPFASHLEQAVYQPLR